MWLKIYKLSAVLAIAYFCKLQYYGEPLWTSSDSVRVNKGSSHESQHK